MRNQSSFLWVFGFEIRKLRLPDELSGTGLTISKATYIFLSFEMIKPQGTLQYGRYLEVTKSNNITNKYNIIMCKYTTTVNAGNF